MGGREHQSGDPNWRNARAAEKQAVMAAWGKWLEELGSNAPAHWTVCGNVTTGSSYVGEGVDAGATLLPMAELRSGAGAESDSP